MLNGDESSSVDDAVMEVDTCSAADPLLPEDPSPPPPPSEGMDFDSNPVAIERILSFGRDLQALYTRLTSTKPNEQLKTMLQVRDQSVSLMHAQFDSIVSNILFV